MSTKSSISFRPVEDRDVKELIQLRTMVKEVIRNIHGSYKGWLCKCDGRIVGFSMGNSEDGEMWVIAVLPEYEGRGIGKRLLHLVSEWLFSFHNELWLTTEDKPANRAYHLYTKAGWKKVSVEDEHCKMICIKQ